MDYEGADHYNGNTIRQCVAVWLQVQVRGCGLGPRPRLYAYSTCDTQRRCSSSVRLVAMYRCYDLTFTTQFGDSHMYRVQQKYIFNMQCMYTLCVNTDVAGRIQTCTTGRA